MKTAIRLFMMAGALALGPAAHAAPPSQIPLRLIGINDFHGNLESTGLSLTLPDPQGGKPVRVPVGGAAAVAGLAEALRAAAPNSLMISGGDLIGASPLVSTLFHHESTIAVMNAIGLDVSTVGNHEFDAGATELRRIAKGGCAPNPPDAIATYCADGPYTGTKFPYLSANVLDAEGHTLFAPYVIKVVDGIRVGIIGAVTRSTPTIVVPSGIAGLTFTDEADAINRAARQLRDQGVRAIVMTIHEGGELGTPQDRGDWNDTRCPDAHGPIFDMARRITKDVGVIFSAHTHQGYRCLVDGRVIIQGTSYGRGLSVVDTVLDRKTRNFVPSLTRSINLPVLNDLTPPELRERLAAATPPPWGDILRQERPDPKIAAMVAGFAAAVAPRAQQPIGRMTGNFPRGGHGEADSPAGRLIADSQLAATRAPANGGAQIALMNPGGIRSDLECRGSAPPCAVTFGQVFSMQPFGNGMVTMTLTGAQLKAVLESQQRAGALEPTFLQPSAGFTYIWQADAAPGERVREMQLDGAPVLPEQQLRVAVNGFLAEGGDSFTGLVRGTARTAGPGDLDALVDYFHAGERAPLATPRVQRRP